MEEFQAEKVVKKRIALHYCSFVFRGLKDHYKDGWNWIDTAFLLLSLIALSIWASIIAMHIPNVSRLDIAGLSTDVAKNEDFLRISYRLLIYTRICSINFILIFIKVLKYLAAWFERVMIIFKTLAWAQSDIFYFLIMYIIIFFAFVVMCHIYYGADLSSFGTIFQSLTTLFLMLLGDLDSLDDMIVLNKVLSFFFFIAFMTSMQFILINMFIAFISNAYSEVNKTISSSKKFEDELKERHWTMRIRDAVRWIGSKVRNNKRKKNIEKQKTERAQDMLRKNMAKKMKMTLHLMTRKDGAKGEQPGDIENKQNELKKEKYLFGSSDNNNEDMFEDNDVAEEGLV